jgi:hypothetical protein
LSALEKERLEKVCSLIRYKNNAILLAKYNLESNFTQSGRAFLKILVGYIKPSFLFKNDVLTPIHLGRAIATKPHTEGIISAQDLQWLYDNMIGDDDFEGNISRYNRRTGFLTGTYWAYKNYEKLGNPEYFGSFGYRRLLDPIFLLDLEKYDMIVPRKEIRKETVLGQYICNHGARMYDKTIKILEKLYPDQVDNVKRFFYGIHIYWSELYIFKKEFFFEFCHWIFPILFELLAINQEECLMSEEELNTILYTTATGLPWIHNLEQLRIYQERDIAFIIERLTGYFLLQLTKRKGIQFKECSIIKVGNGK